MNIFKQFAMLVLLLITSSIIAQKAPTFKKGEDPKPTNKKWELVKEMSDEFNGKKLNNKKWQSSGQDWIGRAPGLFLPENVKVADGYLKITTTKMPKTIVKKGREYTHGGGYVGSREGMTYGYYECEMKANKTFMSSTFWLYNNREDGEGCDKRTTELDIQEAVGQITGDDYEDLKKFKNHMNYNTHSRGVEAGCNVKKDIVGGKALADSNVYDEFHVFGVWWKSKDEVLFFLDGKFVAKVTPPADFNLPMYLRMVVETYNWNPVPADGGMTGTKEDRTTLYNWVRSWKLVD
ncbi:Glycosyl hydrolases family 16 [Lutibacter oricola]|uniref:Glycosyl hydrolases family 16 n=1 Tax=Lutibacter oricola TaxID=762486 RepID=A0A1H2SRC3_9FLAO|nr:family 16 glycosylhydrolase [Lutibacter oricola]SDW34140.1 Glycosyl hydrolases family 16 [Lutibacter oricola]